jgi:integrase
LATRSRSSFSFTRNRKTADGESLSGFWGKFQGLFAKPLTHIARSDVVRVLDEIIASGTPYRANRALAALKKLMSRALDRGMIEVNTIAGLKPPHRERTREVVLSDEELASLIDASDTEGYPFGDVFKMLILTGQRRSEVAEMKWSEIELERELWTMAKWLPPPPSTG